MNNFLMIVLTKVSPNQKLAEGSSQIFKSVISRGGLAREGDGRSQ
jgi:hypothetical protein